MVPPLPWGEGWGEGLGSLVDTETLTPLTRRLRADLSPWERFWAGVFFVAAHRGSAFREDTRFDAHPPHPPRCAPSPKGRGLG